MFVMSRPCWICGSRPAILGDGPKTPCVDCLRRMVEAVWHPERLSVIEAILLGEAHGDVVVLLDLDPPRWRWFGMGY
jgi:hypothetical protein